MQASVTPGEERGVSGRFRRPGSMVGCREPYSLFSEGVDWQLRPCEPLVLTKADGRAGPAPRLLVRAWWQRYVLKEPCTGAAIGRPHGWCSRKLGATPR